MNKPVIVIATYNRPNSLKRLLKSLISAYYPPENSVKLIVSIDGGGICLSEILIILKDFSWKFGEFEIIQHSKNLGLREHIFYCGNLTEQYESIILLEDDIYVAKNFYNYACDALDFYSNKNQIAGISLYSYLFDELTNSIFIPIKSKYDTFLIKVPSSWGQAWTRSQWSQFRKYYNQNKLREIKHRDLPSVVERWSSSSWKKFFYLYMIECDKYFVYPYISLTTNFSDIGAHIDTINHKYQVVLDNNNREYKFLFPSSFVESIVYDSYLELTSSTFILLGAKIDADTVIDLKGFKDLSLFDAKFALSSKINDKSFDKFGSLLIPLENNILYDYLSSQNVFSYGYIYDFKNLNPQLNLFKFQQRVSFMEGEKNIYITKEYKVGKLILHPLYIFKVIKRIFINLINT